MTQPPPTFAILRRLVRGQLEAAERRTVARWLVQHADARISAALDALAVEWSEWRRDESVAEPVRAISRLFWSAFEQRHADIDPESLGRELRLMRGASPSSTLDTGLGVQFVDAGTRLVRLHVRASLSGDYLFSVNDRGTVHALRLTHGVTDYECETGEGRVTFWSLPHQPDAADLESLSVALQAGIRTGEAHAVRITEAFFDEA